VQCSDHFIRHARKAYPPGGSSGGTPSFELFNETVVAAARLYFSRQFEAAPEAAAGVKAWITIGLPFFPPVTFYAARVAGEIQLLDFVADDSQRYWGVRGHVKVLACGQEKSPLVAM